MPLFTQMREVSEKGGHRKREGKEEGKRERIKVALRKAGSYKKQKEFLSPFTKHLLFQREKQVFKTNAGGVIVEAVEINTAGGKITLPSGTYVEVTSDLGEKLKVKAYSGLGGIEGEIPKTAFKEQPRLGNDEKTEKPHEHEYKLYEGKLFTGDKNKPKIEDIDQGGLGDCYLIAAMGAIVAMRPDIIEKMVEYDGSKKVYYVYFQELQSDGKTFKQVKIEVDAYLPTRKGTDKRTAYAMSDAKFDPNNTALWPAIVEKAYAQWKGSKRTGLPKGGYDVIVGGRASEVMTEFTGVKSTHELIPEAKDVIAMFEKFKKENKVVVCGTKDNLKKEKEVGFGGSGVGPYTVTLKGGGSTGAEIVKNTLRIEDEGKKAGTAFDDGEGKIIGSNVKEGSVIYESGGVSLTYKSADKSPSKSDDLKATYDYEGLLSESLNIYGDHAYIFKDVSDKKILFHNPWGAAPQKQPKPLSGEDFVKYIDSIAVNAIPPLRH